MRILSYNCQTGCFGFDFFLQLMLIDCDFYCFQRFPKDWLSAASPLPHFFQESFPGAEFGCVTFTRQPFSQSGGNTLPTIYTNDSQSSAFVKTSTPHFTLINTLPPYQDENVSLAEHETHVQTIKNFSDSKTIVVGDFHRDGRNLSATFYSPFTNHSNKTNFYDDDGKPFSLTKFLADFPLKVREETVLPVPLQKMRHQPVVFEF